MAILHLVDGTYELFRAHYSKRPSAVAPDGADVKATLGVVSSLLSLVQETAENVTHVACAFDNPIRSFRNDLFPDYKSDEGVEPALRAQFDLVEEAVTAMGITVWSMKQFEADDALATAAQKYFHDASEIRILSPDKDLGQCLRGAKVVQIDRRQEKRIDEETFRQQRGFAPESLPDFLALVGDSADGIPGLKGWGEKASSVVLGEYVHLEQIPPQAADWKVKIRGAEALAATLRDNMSQALLYRQLATVNTKVPLAESFDALAFRGVPLERFRAFCERLGNASLPGKVKRTLGA